MTEKRDNEKLVIVKWLDQIEDVGLSSSPSSSPSASFCPLQDEGFHRLLREDTGAIRGVNEDRYTHIYT